MLSDPWFYLLSIPAVLIYGIGKGGLGGALGILAVPMMALVVPPTQAAAILLPILLVMDVFAVRHHYKNADYNVLKNMFPGALLGVVLAGMLLSITSEPGLKITVGGLSLLFCFQFWLSDAHPSESGKLGTWVWSTLSGFSSTAIHAGGGPASIYLLPLRMPKTTLIATMAVLFAMVNVAKLVPYVWLGEFDTTNLMTALVLVPLAPLGVKMGVYLLHLVSQEKIYQLCYLFLFLSGAKLTFDGISTLFF
ncbi:sulfite exporter TauE/SafE family protein [Vibrio natriegens]|uniref:sulfite exporter TauE/SafE family protein n=1 Tax=Vibrio natriegens TaxID=691 RepID=UPI001FBA0C33|nr:sulfite exporter TauE/SafE family protein [Vibrio natriegens]